MWQVRGVLVSLVLLLLTGARSARKSSDVDNTLLTPSTLENI